jgi:hypothetical protein
MAKKRNRIVAGVVITLALLLGGIGAVLYSHPLWVLDRYQAFLLRIQGVESRVVYIDGHHIHYYVRGPADGSPIVLVHGLGGRAENWIHLSPYLAKAGYRVYTPDLLGFGQSEEPLGATYSIADQAKLVVKFFDAMVHGRLDRSKSCGGTSLTSAPSGAVR